MERITISEKIFSKQFNRPTGTFLFSDLPKDIRETDEIYYEDVEAHYSENDSWDDYAILEVYRDRLETDEEFEKRKEEKEMHNSIIRENRYQTYLKLKEEFEKEELENEDS